MPGKVADASVIAAIAFQESRAAEAKAQVGETELWAPPLLRYELASTARKKARAYPTQAQAIAEQLQAALSMDILWHEVDHLAVLRLALATGLSTYDASYLWLARTLAVPLVTFDERLRAAL